MMTASRIVSFAIRPDGTLSWDIAGPVVLDDDGHMLDQQGAGEEVDRLVRHEAEVTGGTYAEALGTVTSDPGLAPLVRLYAERAAQQPHPREAAGRELDLLARKHAIQRDVPYSVAFQAILANPVHAELRRVYATGFHR